MIFPRFALACQKHVFEATIIILENRKMSKEITLTETSRSFLEMNFLQKPDLLFHIIEGIERDLNSLADAFVENVDDSFYTFYTICEESNLLSIYDYRPATLQSARRVQQHYNLLTEILLRGAKRIWTNPRNNFKKRIAGFYMISILYVNQPMPGYPVKIPLEPKEIFCAIGYLYEILIKSAKKIPRFLSICSQTGNIFKRLLKSNSFEFTVESEQFNVLPERRIIIETYLKLDCPERLSKAGMRQFSLIVTTSAPKKNEEKQKPLSTDHMGSFPNSVLSRDTNTAYAHAGNNKSRAPTGMEIVSYKRDISSESWVSCQNELDQSSDDEYDSECEERNEDDGYNLLLSGNVPQPHLEEGGSFRKTAASMQAQEDALRFLMHKNTFKPSRSRFNTEEERGKADVHLILRTIEVAKERCYTLDGDNQVRRSESFLPPEFLKLKQAAIESVRINYGVIQRETPITEEMWLSKDVKNGSKALSIFKMHQQGTLEKNERIRLVTKCFNNKEAQVLVENVSTGMDDENLYNDKKDKKIKAEYESKDCRRKICHWDPYFYQPKYINNYHRQLQNIVKKLEMQNKYLTDPWADTFVKRFRLDNEFTKYKPSLVLHTDENQKDSWLVNNFFGRRINSTNPIALQLPVYYKYFRRQECILPLKNLNSNDVEMSGVPVEDRETAIEPIDAQNSTCKTLVKSPMKDLMFPIQTVYYYYNVKKKEYSDEEVTEFENSNASASSSPKILSMPNLDTFFGMD